MSNPNVIRKRLIGFLQVRLKNQIAKQYVKERIESKKLRCTEKEYFLVHQEEISTFADNQINQIAQELIPETWIRYFLLEMAILAVALLPAIKIITKLICDSIAMEGFSAEGLPAAIVALLLLVIVLLAGCISLVINKNTK